MASDAKFIDYLKSLGIVNPRPSKRTAKSADVFCFSFDDPLATQRNLAAVLGKPTRERFMFGGSTTDSLLFIIKGKGTVRIGPKLLEGNLVNAGSKKLTQDQMLVALRDFRMDPGTGYGVTYPVAPAVRALLLKQETPKDLAILSMRNGVGNVAVCYKREYGKYAHPEVVDLLKECLVEAKKKLPSAFAKEHEALRDFAISRLSKVTDADIDAALKKYGSSGDVFEDARERFMAVKTARQQPTETLVYLLRNLTDASTLKSFTERLNGLLLLGSALKTRSWYYEKR